MLAQSTIRNPQSAIRPIQRRLLTVQVDAPLWTVEMARGLLHCTAEDVAALIEFRNLAWAWDIGRDASRRGEVRILSRSVNGLHTRAGKADCFDAVCGLADERADDIINWILAREKALCISTTRIEQLLVCSIQLVYELIRDGELKLTPGSDAPRRGKNGQGSVTRESVVQFLKRRRIQ